LDDELAAIGDTETKKLLREQEKIEQQSEELSKRQGEIDKELEHQDELKRAISNRLLELSGAEELQHLRDELEAQAESIREQLKQAKDTLKRAVSTRGYIVLLSEVTNEFRGIVDNLRRRGELPTGIKQQFVKELLERERCICGAELTEGTHAHELVQAWMDRAGIADIEETAIRMEAQVDEIDQQAPEFWQVIDRQQVNINQFRIELSRIETELDDIKIKLRNYPNEDISKLQKRLDETEEKVRELTLEKGVNKQKIDSLKSETDVKVKQITKYKMKEDKQALAQRRIAAAQEAIERSRLDMEVKSAAADRTKML